MNSFKIISNATSFPNEKYVLRFTNFLPSASHLPSKNPSKKKISACYSSYLLGENYSSHEKEFDVKNTQCFTSLLTAPWGSSLQRALSGDLVADNSNSLSSWELCVRDDTALSILLESDSLRLDFGIVERFSVERILNCQAKTWSWAISVEH